MEMKEQKTVQQQEEEILEFWKKNKIYEKVKKKNEKGKNFYFLQGPPYTSGRLHIGHAWNNGMKDMILRYKRMNGLNVWDRAGYDMHGLPTENAVQKKLGIKDKLEIENFGVEKFIKECIKFSSENAIIMNQDLKRLGIWMNFEDPYLPITSDFIEGEWWLMKRAWEQQRLYKGKKVMHWCSTCETSLAKHELEYENVKDNSIFLKFKIKDKKNEYFIIWTTTPWTIPFNLAVMVNPDLDYVKAEVETENGKEVWVVAKALSNVFISGLLGLKFKILGEIKGRKLEGIKYIHPLNEFLKKEYEELGKEWKNLHSVILSSEYVDTSAGSGLVHCAPGCGPEDFEVGKKYGLGAFNNLNEKGEFFNMGKFNGLVAKRDDKKFTEFLKETGSLITQTKVEHEYAHCWRCHNPVVFRTTEQWFMKIEDLIPKLLDENKKVEWQPKFASKNYDLWVENLKDNGITRQRYWGCPAPIWICDKCNSIEVIGRRKELEEKVGKKNVPGDLHKPWIDSVKWKCESCKKGKMERVKDVIDVWVDSGTTSWNCLYYPNQEKYFDLFPADFILEATEQIKLWFSMLQMCSMIAFGKGCYKNVYCHGMILDYQGVKMSKSLGNIISPYEVVDKYGADILRYYIMQTPAGENISFNWEAVKEKQRNITVLSNIAKYILEIDKQEKGKIGEEDKYILSRKNSTIKKVTELMEEYRLDEVIEEIEKLYLDLSRIYIKIIRDRQNKIAYETIKEVYIDVVKMFSIICPFISERIWQALRKNKEVKEESIHLSEWPKTNTKDIDLELEREFVYALKIIEVGLAERDKAKIGLKWPLAKADVKFPEKISKKLEEIIAKQLNVKKIEIVYGKEVAVSLDLNMTEALEAEGFARELSRTIQAERKKAGFVKQDEIELEISCDLQMEKLLKMQQEFLKERVNANKFSFKKAEKKLQNSVKTKIKERDFEINFSKI